MNPIVKKICNLIKSQDRDTQVAAIRVLSELGVRDQGSIKLVGEAIQHSQTSALKEMLLEIPLRTPFRGYLNYLIPCLTDANINREKIVTAIAAIGAPAVPVLKKRYPKASEFEKRAILIVFSRIHDRHALELLIESLLDSREVEHLKFVCGLLKDPIERFAKADRRKIRQLLIRFFKRAQTKKNNTVLVSALILLGYLQDAAVKSLLLGLVRHTKDVFILKYTLIALAKLNLAGKQHDDALQTILPVLAHEDFPNVVKNALGVIQNLEIPKRLQPQISKLLESTHPSVRSFALSKLGTFDSKENVTTLISYLGSADFRIREAAKNSLEKMPRAVPALMQAFEAAGQEDQGEQIIAILKNHRSSFKPAMCKRLFTQLDKRFRAKDDKFRRYGTLLKAVNPDYLYKAVLGVFSRFKRNRKWAEALGYLNLLHGSFLYNSEVRYESALMYLKLGKNDFTNTAREQHQGLQLLQALVKNEAEGLYKRLLKERSLTTQDLYFIGFHCTERLFEVREFGVKLLKYVMKRAPSSEAGRLAKRKLATIGSSSHAGINSVPAFAGRL